MPQVFNVSLKINCMKKPLLFVFGALLLSSSVSFASNPEVIYIGTWQTMYDLGTPVTPDANDPQLLFNSESGCFEGDIFDWAKTDGISSWNAKIPYSVGEEGEVTYYSGTSAPNIVFNTVSTASYTFGVYTDPADPKLYGYNIGTANTEGVVAAHVVMNLEDNLITFTQIENETQAPELVSIDPANGSWVTPDAEGAVAFSLTFSGEITSMRVMVEGSTLTPQVSEDGMVWSYNVPANRVAESVREADGFLLIRIDQVFAGSIPVALEGNETTMFVSYAVEGYTNSVTINFIGEEDALATLDVYQSPFYTVGNEIGFSDDVLHVTYSSSITYLFTVAEEYTLNVTSEVDPEFWSLGTATSQKVTFDTDNGTSEEEPYRTGTTLTILGGAAGGEFSVNIVDKMPDADSVSQLLKDNEEAVIYNLNGVRVDGRNLTPGIYIVKGKKMVVK